MNDVELLDIIVKLKEISNKGFSDEHYECYLIDEGHILKLERDLFDMYVKKVRSKKHE